jgi:hypothetical protein
MMNDEQEDIPETLRVPYSWREDDQRKEMDLLDTIIAECQASQGSPSFGQKDPIA